MRSMHHCVFLILACLPFALAQAHPDSSRQQVLDELAQARASGNIEIAGELGGLARDRYPGLYPRVATPGLAREAVRQDLQAALRRGALPHGDLDLPAGGAQVASVAAQDAAQGKTRAQVRAELAQAVRSGDVEEIGEGGRLLRDLPGRRMRAEAGSHYAMSAAS